MVAQQAVFTIHGTKPTSIDEILETCGDRDLKHIARIDLEKGKAAQIKRDLDILGVNTLALFPELQNVAESVKERYGLKK